MNWLDVAFLAIIGVSALISLLRGFVREVLSVIAWVAAVWVGVRYTPELGGYLSQWIASPTLQMVAAFASLFVGVLVLGAIVNTLAAKLVGSTGLTGTDRMIGLLFGVMRGALVVAVLVLVAGLTPMPQETWWRQSLLAGQFQQGVCRIGVEDWLTRVRVALPTDVAETAAQGVPLADHWAEFCGREAAGKPLPAEPAPED